MSCDGHLVCCKCTTLPFFRFFLAEPEKVLKFTSLSQVNPAQSDWQKSKFYLPLTKSWLFQLYWRACCPFPAVSWAANRHGCLPLADDVRPSRVSVSFSDFLYLCDVRDFFLIHFPSFSGQLLSCPQRRCGNPSKSIRHYNPAQPSSGFNVLTQTPWPIDGYGRENIYIERIILMELDSQMDITWQLAYYTVLSISSVYFRLDRHGLVTWFRIVESRFLWLALLLKFYRTLPTTWSTKSQG